MLGLRFYVLQVSDERLGETLYFIGSGPDGPFLLQARRLGNVVCVILVLGGLWVRFSVAMTVLME